jgi:competence protein ComEC
MGIGSLFSVSHSSATSRPFLETNLSVWQAPLVPAALILTLGIVLDRNFSIPFPFSLLILFAGLIAWSICSIGSREEKSGRQKVGLIYLWLALAGFGAAHHHWQRDSFAPNDIGNFATSDPQPVRARGIISEEPSIRWQSKYDPLRSFPGLESTRAGLRVFQIMGTDDWIQTSGQAQLIVSGPLQDIHVGDEVEVDGRLIAPQGPANPGELDTSSYLRDRHIRAIINVRKTSRAVHLVQENWKWTVAGRLAMIRSWGERQLQEVLSENQAPMAMALLLGEGSALGSEGWEKYVRNGVIHILVISGQQLMILSAFIWGVFRVLGIRRRRSAWLVGLFLLVYAVMTGGRPPAMRAAVIMGVWCLAVYLRRPVFSANSLALAWIVVTLINPTDIFAIGCQLSFLAVIILHWGTSLWRELNPDPLQRLIEESRPPWIRVIRWVGKRILITYAITGLVLVLQAPLVASHTHLISPIALLISPLLIFLITISLISGFLLLFSCTFFLPFTPLLGFLTQVTLNACEKVVDWSDGLAWGHWYVSDVPAWWLWVFYTVLLAMLTQHLLRKHWRWGGLAGLGWLCIGLVIASPFVSGSSPFRGFRQDLAEDELRCTFLAVGHGGCTVLEMPDGRTVLYDSGAMEGPDVTRRQIAPFIWRRGIRRIDEVILSHADLDHFNGLPALLDRFAVGQITSTPSFADKSTPGVRETLAAIERHGIPLRIVKAGEKLSAGTVEIDVLHPPQNGPEGKENFRSLVLVIRHAGHSIMLTGDLEGPGLTRVVDLPPPRVDVLMAPHHGSRAGGQSELVNRTDLALLTRPWIIVSCQGLPLSSPSKPIPYAISGSWYLGTWPHGAVTIRSYPGQLEVETFKTRQRRSKSSKDEVFVK